MRRASYVALAGLFTASGCAGGGNQTFVPHSAQQTQRATVAFTMHWPTKAISTSRSPKFISPSTLSVVVEVNNDPTLTTIANNPGSGTSTINLNAPVGSDDFIISLYDQPQQSGETAPVGNELGQVEMVQSIKAGQTNVVSATVNGIAAKVVIAPLANQSFVTATGTASAPSYTIAGQNGATFSLTALDADGNAIVGTGITPVVSLRASANTSNWSVLPVSAEPSRFTVVATAPSGSSGGSTLIAQATDAMGDTVSLNVPVSEIGEVYVSYPSASGSKIAAYDTNGTPIALPSGAFGGLQNPVSMLYDAVDQQVLVADSSLGEVLAFDPQGNPKAGFTPIALPNVNSVTIDNFADHIVASSDTSGVFAAMNSGQLLSDPYLTQPFSITTGAGILYYPVPPNAFRGNELLVADTSQQQLDVYSSIGNPTFGWPQTYVLSTPAGTPGAMATDGQAVYVSGSASGSGTLWEIPINSGVSTSVNDPGVPAGIAYDSLTNELFVAESADNQVSAYKPGLIADPSHTFSTPSSLGLSSPQGITIAY